MSNPHDHRDLTDLNLPAPQVPQRVSVDGLEERWANIWEEQQVYAFNRQAQRSEVFSIDTPPPTASGSLHVGHVFSYTHTDCLARYQRMQGKEPTARAKRCFTPWAGTIMACLPSGAPKTITESAVIPPCPMIRISSPLITGIPNR